MSAPSDIVELLSTLSREDIRERWALSFYQGAERVGRQTYGELHSRVERLAGFLAGELKVASGDRVLILAPNRLEIPALVLALWRAGAVVVPLNPTAPSEDWSYIANHSRARGAFGTPELLARLKSIHGSLEFLQDVATLADAKGKLPDAVSQPDELAIVLYTSGTTGTPKGVGLCQRNLLANARSMAARFALNRTTQFAVLPLYHAHALGFGLMSALGSGGHLVFTDKLDPFAWARVIREEKVEFTSVVPSLLPVLLASRVRQEQVPELRAILVSSAPLTAELALEFETKTGIALVQGWGLSEYTNFACCMSPASAPENRKRLLLESEIPSVGSALEGAEVKVIDDTGKPVAEGVPGELCVKGPSLMLGYYLDPDATRATLADGWLRTGDQGYFRRGLGPHEKPVFYISGRIKELIIRDGEKFSPLGIEKKLKTRLPELEGKLVVLGFPHRLHGEEIGVYLVTAELGDEATALLLDRLAEAIQSLTLEERPKILLHSATPVPKTHTGKVQRRKLQSLFAAYTECKGKLKIVAA